jgi:hypothetical protein
MSLVDFFIKSDPLAQFDTNEATDLALHVRQCARRYGALSSKISIAIVLIAALLIIQALDIDIKETITAWLT